MAFDASAGVDQVTLTAEDCLSWTAKRNDSWITITSGGNGVGNGTVDYSVSSNWRTTPRTGSLTIAGKTFIVYQAAGDTPCSEGPVRTGPSDFATIKEAYNAALDGETLYCHYFDFSEDLNFNRDVSIKLEGGYDCHFTANPDETTIKGKMTIRKGTVTLKKIVLAPQ